MCRIYGIIHLDGSSADPVFMGRMGDVIRQRGPDDQGWHHDGNCVIGMRRLSIIDLAGWRQPLTNDDRTHWCLDVTLNDDQMRARIKNAGAKLAIIRCLVLNLFCLDTSKREDGIHTRRILAASSDSYRANLLGLEGI